MSSNSQIKDAYPLTSMQAGMFFHAIREPDSSVYVTQVAYRLQGELDRDAVRYSLDKLSERHDILKTVFLHKGLDEVYQVVNSQMQLPMNYEEVNPDLTFEEREAYVKEKMVEDRKEGFDLAKGPLFRVSIFKLDEGQFDFVWSHHHILLDGWSVSIVMEEFFYLYRAAQQKREPILPERPSYKKYIQWLHGQSSAEAKDFWQTYLENVGQATGISPLRKANDQSLLYENEDYFFTLNNDYKEALEALARKHRTTLNMVLQSVWGILLAKYNQSRDVVFGNVVSGRPASLRGVEQMVGLFINAIPVRVKYEEGATFEELLTYMHSQKMAADPHQYTSLADIQSLSSLKHHLIDHVFVFENYPTTLAEDQDGQEETKWDMNVTDASGASETNYSFNLNISLDDEILFRLDWDKNQYDRSMIKGLMNSFKILITQVLEDDACSIDEMEVLDEAQIKDLVTLGQGTQIDHGQGRSLYDCWKEQVELRADQVALWAEGRSWTYQEANAEINRLAAHLKNQLEVQKGDRVGVLLPRSSQAYFTCWAIWSVGATYVPIDLKYPRERILWMLEDANINTLLTQSEYLFELAGEFTGKLFATDLEWDGLPEASEQISVEIPGEQDAYLIYTSGTSGKPKGVCISHKSMVDRILFHNEYLPVTTEDKVMQFASLGFDSSLVETLMAALAGTSLMIAPETHKANLTLLAEWIDEKEISVAILPPAILNSLVGNPLPSLKSIISTGEAANLEACLYYAPGKKVLNGYGPTETCIGATFYQIDADQAQMYRLQGQVPIGKPFDNTLALLFDDQGKLVPMGSKGEVCIGGIGLSRGYQNREDLTQNKFFSVSLPGYEEEIRLYKTGDQGYWNAKGELMYAGRKDDQVQIHGARVELGEIENHLLQHENIKQAVVKVLTDPQGLPQLVAYVQNKGEGIGLQAIRSFLSDRLPLHMIPNWIEEVPSFALTVNGKIDKETLPPIDWNSFSISQQYQAPQSELEEELAKIWQQVLGKERIGVSDDFFELGGQSLKATQIISRVYKYLKIRIELNDLFTNSTVAALAQRIESKETEQEVNEVVPLPTAPDYPTSSAQRRLWMVAQMKEAQSAYLVPGAYLMEGPLNMEAFKNSIKYLMDRHEMLRTGFVVRDGELRQKIFEVEDIPMPVVQHDYSQEKNQEESIEDLASEYFQQAFDLSQPPLFHVAVVKMDENKHLMLLTLHHIISDGWSMDIFFEELQQAYQTYNLGETVEKPALKVQYKEYADWQIKQLSGESFEKLQTYWLEQFAGTVPQLNLPTNFPRPLVKSYQGRTLGHSISPARLAGMRRLAKQHEASLFMVLMASIKTFLHQLSQQDDIVIGTASTGRSHPAWENQLGMYTQTLAIRSQINPDQSFSSFLTKIRKQVLEAYRHQAYPFEELVQKLDLAKDFSRAPLFDVMVVHQEKVNVSPTEENYSPELRLSAYPLPVHVSRYDLIFGFYEQENELQLGLEYSKDLFHASHIYALLDRYDHLLDQILANANNPISTFNLDLVEETQLEDSALGLDIQFNFDFNS